MASDVTSQHIVTQVTHDQAGAGLELSDDGEIIIILVSQHWPG